MATRISRRSGRMRKQPQQARSRATLEAILEATTHILGQRGWDGLTTNAAAEAAGVSIGSLYQYFPNKLALVEAVRQRHFDQVLTVLRSAANGALSRSRRVAALVDGMIGLHRQHAAAHRVLLEEAPKVADVRAAHDRFASRLHEHYEAIIRCGRGGHSRGQTRTAAQVLAAAVAGAVHDAAVRGTLSSEAFRCELQVLVAAYLKA
jgi:AcrR family transcriptional regulator